MEQTTTKVIAVTSGKGGTGKSSFCAALALTYARHERKVLLVELDFGLRCLDLFSGMEHQIVYDFGDVLSGRCPISKAIVTGERYPTLSYLPAANQPLSDWDWDKLEGLCRPVFSKYDLVIIDTPAGLQSSTEAVARLSDLAVIVATPDPVCIRDAAKIGSMLHKRKFQEYYLVINRISKKNIKQGLIRNIDAVMDEVGAPLLGILPEEPRLQQALTQGKWPVKKSLLPAVLEALMHRIEGEYVPLVIQKL